MKRRKTSSFSDLSTGSESPRKKHIYHDLSEDYRSSPEISSPITSNYGHNLWPQSRNQIDRRDLLHPSVVSNWVNQTASQTPRSSVRTPSIDADQTPPHHHTHHLMSADSHQSDNIYNDDGNDHGINRTRYRDSGCGTTNGIDSDSSVNSGQRPRTTEDFYLFCQFILEYENYDGTHNQEVRVLLDFSRSDRN